MLRSPGLLETARRTWGVRHIFAATLAGRFLRTINSAIWLFQHFFFNFPSKIIVQVYCCHTISKHVVHHYHAPFRCGRFASIKDGQVERRDNDAVCQLGHMLWLWYVSPPPLSSNSAGIHARFYSMQNNMCHRIDVSPRSITAFKRVTDMECFLYFITHLLIKYFL